MVSIVVVNMDGRTHLASFFEAVVQQNYPAEHIDFVYEKRRVVRTDQTTRPVPLSERRSPC